MGIATIIELVLRNTVVWLFVIAIIVTIVKVRREGSNRNAAFILLGEVLFYCVGIGLIWAFVFHAFAQETAATSIGWTPSPFEWELAWAELGMAFTAIVALWSDYRLRVTATLMFAIFCTGATIQHINQIICCHNYAPGNAGIILWFNDIALPVFMLVVAVLARRTRALSTATAR